MTLRQARCLMATLVAQLVQEALRLGYEIALDEGKNNQGVGHKVNSNHYLGLAQDFLLYKNGKYLTLSEDYKDLGEFWKTLHPLCRWGGDFKDGAGRPKPDGNHVSLEWGGRK